MSINGTPAARWVLCAIICAATATLAGQEPQRKNQDIQKVDTALAGAQERPVVKAWGVLFQVVKAIEKYISTGELGGVHNEDVTLKMAVYTLRSESHLAPPEKKEELENALSTFGRQVGDLHTAADAFDQPRCEAILKEVLRVFDALKRYYSEEVFAPARLLAEKSACPMHRDATGKSTDKCPKCGMELDQPIRVPLHYSGGTPAEHTVEVNIRTEAPLEVGKRVNAILRLTQLGGAPVLITDLRVVHTERIHLLVIDPSLTDYHHVHPRPTDVPGDYAFSFIPKKTGPYRAWADLRTTYTGFQEYAATDLPSAGKAEQLSDREMKLSAEAEGLRYELILDQPKVKVDGPVRAKLRVTDLSGKPFTGLEPVMATFAHLVGFNEDYQTVLHMHPKGSGSLKPTDRGGPDLEFQIYATRAGFYRLFAQVQIKGDSKFVPFGLEVVASP
jgi:hypothetical protein